MMSNRRGFLAMTILRWAQLPHAGHLRQEPAMEKYSSANVLANQGVPTMIDAEHAIAHSKIVVIDGETSITGSFNFTKAAQEKKAENLLLIRYQALAAQHTQNSEAHRQHSQPHARQGVVR
jgi:phosphatidylserine/phosphatidylglycerophosphate/cardiolipin synthase-like enzyme